MKKRLKEMEEEAAALRDMQAKVEKEMGGSQDSALANGAQANREEADARSVFVGNVKKKTARQKVREKSSKQETAEKRDEDAMVQDAASEWGSEDGRDPKSERASVKRKMAKQMRFLNRLEETQRVLSAKKTISKKRRKSQTGKALNDLSSLSEFLPSITSSTTAATTKILRSKAKQKIVTNETKQLAAVLAHPQFKANPFAAIQQHLATTIPATALEPVVKAPAKAGSKKKK